MRKLSRRDALVGGLAGVAGFALERTARAIEPFERPEPTGYKFALSAYSLREQFQAGTLDLPGYLDRCAEWGFAGAEPTSYYFPESFDDAFLARLKRRARVLGLTMTGGAIRNDFCRPDGPNLEADLEHTRRWVDTYAKLGAPAIRVFAGTVPKGDEKKAAIRRCVANLEKACEYAGSRGVFLALENHGGITARAADMLEIVRGVRSPWLGVNFDSGNFRTNAYEELAQIAPYAVNAQMKTEVWRDGEKEPIDFARVMGILRDANYRGWIALEYEGGEEPEKAIPRHLDELREAAAKVFG